MRLRVPVFPDVPGTNDDQDPRASWDGKAFEQKSHSSLLQASGSPETGEGSLPDQEGGRPPAAEAVVGQLHWRLQLARSARRARDSQDQETQRPAKKVPKTFRF